LLDRLNDDKIKNEPYYDKGLQLASVGDWCTRSRIEDTWLNSHELALKIVSNLNNHF